MTRAILQAQFQFSEGAAAEVADANAAVDEKQGSDEGQTKLHAMVGKDAEGHLVDPSVTKKDVANLLAEKRAGVLAAVAEGKGTAARKLLGEALHTIQDRAFHNFEPWPYDGLADAVANNPNYMVCHAVRDVGKVSKLEVKASNSSARLAVEGSWAINNSNDAFLSVQGFTDFGTGPPRYAGPPVPLGRDPLGTGVIVSFSIPLPGFGAAPGSIRPRLLGRGDAPDDSADDPNRILTDGPASEARARNDSVAYIGEIHGAILGASGQAGWDELRGSKGESAR
jgi:hypothetical protein